MSQRVISLFDLNGDPIEIVIDGESSDKELKAVTGLHLRQCIQHSLDMHTMVATPLEVIAIMNGDKVLEDTDQVVLDTKAPLQFVKRQFPLLRFQWMMFHMWENLLAGDEHACPTSCEDYVIFYRKPVSSVATGYTEGDDHPKLYYVTWEQLCIEAQCWNTLQHVDEEVLLLESESTADQNLPPGRASVFPHLSFCDKRQKLADAEKILVYTEVEWRIAIYQEIEVNRRPWQEVFSVYPYEDLIETFLSKMSWSHMRGGRPSRIAREVEEKCRLSAILKTWIEHDPYSYHLRTWGVGNAIPSLPDELEKVNSIILEAWGKFKSKRGLLRNMEQASKIHGTCCVL